MGMGRGVERRREGPTPLTRKTQITREVVKRQGGDGKKRVERGGEEQAGREKHQ